MSQQKGSEFRVQDCSRGAQSPRPWWQGTFEERMAHRAARRASPEFKMRIEAIKRRRRLCEIWRAIIDHDQLLRASVPFQIYRKARA